jgi:hypothetical protein
MAPISNSVGNTLKALLAGWIGIVFGTSVLIYFLSPLAPLTYHPNPAVKLSIVAVFGALVFAFRPAISRRPAGLVAGSVGFALVAVLLVLALLPAGLSRGYGIGLSGARFDPAILPLYLAGALLGGAVFAYAYIRLARAK